MYYKVAWPIICMCNHHAKENSEKYKVSEKSRNFWKKKESNLIQ